MLPSGTARSTPSTATLPSKALKRPFASIAKPFATCVPCFDSVVASDDVRRQAGPWRKAARKSGGARLLRGRPRKRGRRSGERRAAPAMARGRGPWRYDLDGGDGRSARLARRAVARSEVGDLARHEL